MKIYKGKSVSGGIAIGRIIVWKKDRQQIKPVRIGDADGEIERYRAARQEAVRQLQSLYERALQEVGEADAAIFEAHQMMLEDDDYNKYVETIVRSQNVNAEYAVSVTGDYFARMFAAMKDDYMRERAADVRDISGRLLAVLNGKDDKAAAAASGEPVILVADELSPSETVRLDKSTVVSFVTVHGTPNSHTAILAGTMAIPALVGASVPADASVDGKTGIVDGINGIFYVDPDEETLENVKKLQREEQDRRKMLRTLRGKEDVTPDGKRMMLYANIGNVRDLETAIQNDAAGIGLFRSEFLYLESDHAPTEEEQFRIYKQAAEAMAGKNVIIRTLDMGADKRCGYFRMEHEENPALGCRGIRVSLSRPEIFKIQLRALYRASAFGNLAIMYPMITSVREVRRAKELAALIREELDRQGIRRGDPQQGIMIETPAAALISDELAKEADFFSIGTNDLTQYTLALDRQNGKLEEFYDPHHPAVLRMISLVTENAHKAGIPVGICGELAADRFLTGEFLAMGVDELSVSPDNILPVRKIILETNVEEYRKSRSGKLQFSYRTE